MPDVKPPKELSPEDRADLRALILKIQKDPFEPFSRTYENL